MAPQSWFRGPVCGVDNCRSRLYRSSDGLTICQFGHVMEGNIEINDDQDQVTVTTRRLNVVNVDERGGYTSSPVVNSQKAISKKSTRLYGSEARELYFKCLQMLLKKQCEIFMTLFFSESMRDDLFQLVKTNWVKCLGITYEHKNNELDDHTNESNEDEESEKEEQGKDDDGQNTKKERIKVESKYYTVNTLDLISLIYISALQLRFQLIYINDIVKHIKSNEIPYVRTLHILPKSTLDKLPMPYHHMLQPLRLPLQLDLYHCIRINGLRLKVGKLDMPLNYYYPFAFKVFSDIFLFPNAIDLFNVFTNLMEAILLTELLFSFTYKTTVLGVIGFPEIQILGAIVFVIKLTFVSNPFKYMLHPKVWLDRLGKFEMNNEYSYIKSDNSDLLDWSDDKIEKYCDWIYDHIIPKKNKTYNLDGDHEDYLVGQQEELTTMEKRLFQIFNVDARTEESPEPVPKRVKLDTRQNKDSIHLSAKESLLKMTKKKKKNNRKVTYEDILAVEGKLLSRICELFWVTPDALARSYENIEKLVKRDILDKGNRKL